MVLLSGIEEYFHIKKTEQVNVTSTPLCAVFVWEDLNLACEILGSQGDQYEHGSANYQPDHGGVRLSVTMYQTMIHDQHSRRQPLLCSV